MTSQHISSRNELYNYLDQIALFHYNNFHEEEISVRFGLERIKFFYKSLIDDKSCKVDIKISNNKIIFCYCFS